MTHFQEYIDVEEIQIADNRQRRTFEEKALNELAESIQQHGLFHPVVIREEGGKKILVSGERRLRAIKDIYALGGSFRFSGWPVTPPKIPYVTLGELDDLAREEAELDENIRRTDLSWQERAEATARLAALRTGQMDSDNRPRPSVADISLEVRGSAEGIHHETTRREIIVAKHLGDPEVRAAKTVDDAFKVLKRKEDVAKRVQLAAEVGKTFTAEAHRVFHANALEWLKECTGRKSFDVILTDPPYGMGADEFGDSGGMTPGAHQYADTYEYWKALMDGFLEIRVSPYPSRALTVHLL